MKKKIVISLLTAGLLLGALAGCKGNSTNNPGSSSNSDSDVSTPTEEYSFTATAPATIGIGETGVIEITENNKKEGENTAFTFESKNTAVATVDANGVVTGVAAGTTQIVASFIDDDVSYVALCTVTVTGESEG